MFLLKRTVGAKCIHFVHLDTSLSFFVKTWLNQLGSLGKSSSPSVIEHCTSMDRPLSTGKALCVHTILPLSPVIWWIKLGGKSFIIRSAETLPIICAWGALGERERERHTEVTSPFSHWNWRWVYTFPCQKFALGDEFTLSLARKSHFSFLPSHFLSHPS